MKPILSQAIISVFGGGSRTRSGGGVTPLIFTATIFAFALFISAAVSASVADGDKAMAAERYRAAIIQYEAYLKENPNDGAVMIKAAQAYEGAKWWGQAVQWWDKYVDKYPGDPQADNARKHAADCHRWLGSTYYIIGESYLSAVEELDKSLALDPKLADAYVWLATIYQNEGLYEKTVEILDIGLAALPNDEVLIMMRKDAQNYRDNGGNAYIAHRKGISLYENGDKAGSLEMFRSAIEANPEFAAAHLWTARILFEQGHFADSIPEWQDAIRIRPDNEHALFYLQLAQHNAAAKE